LDAAAFDRAAAFAGAGFFLVDFFVVAFFFGMAEVYHRLLRGQNTGKSGPMPVSTTQGCRLRVLPVL
jgi:hypothetical protein